MLCRFSHVQLFATLWTVAHGILQARILEWVALPSFRGIFLTQGLNLHLLHCRQILWHYTTQEAPQLYVVVCISSAPPGPLVDDCILFLFSFHFYWTIVALQCCVIVCGTAE